MMTTAKFPPYWQNGVIKTKNSMGIMTTDLSPSTKEFVKYCSPGKKVVDIGCAFGAATFPALEKGAEVIACDIGKEHLDFITESLDPKFCDKLTIVHGDFLSDLDIKPNSLSAIHISQVIHFLTGDQIEITLKKFHEWLQPDGKLYIVNMTADLGIYKQNELKAEIQNKKLRGEKWPGEIKQRDFARPEYVPQIPVLAHFFDKDFLSELLEKNGFSLEYIDYFRFENIPEFYKTSGKEYLATVAKKS